ncbi:MAG: zinc ribbon domain-containing protein [Heliobacteriaceae bacterium]|nr:zinc ribbon domain-containing protein [Heliobacteriaceae bacterium]
MEQVKSATDAPGRIYRCKCRYELHRDIHGARNILAKAKYGEIIEGGIAIPKRTMYLRPAA